MDLAALDIKIGADLSELQKDLGTAGTYVDTFAKNLASIGSSSAAAAGGMSEIAKGANQISEAFKTAPSSVDALEQSITELANEFDAKWGPIVADAAKLPPVLNASVTNAKQLQTQFAAFGKLSPFKNASADITKFSLATKPIPQNLDKTKQATQSANLALTNLGRVIQDLPFGFVGISNNLNPLTEGFQRLKLSAKDAGVSLSSVLLKSLTGPGGLGIAISVVSAALTVASFGMSAWTRGFGKNKEAVDDAIQSNEDYAKSLSDITQNAIKSAEKEITDITILTKLAQDNTAALNTRLDAANKLQEQNGYFAALSKEQLLYGDITTAVNQARDAILNKYYADAAGEKAALAAARVYTLTKQQTAAQKELNQAQADYVRVGGSGAGQAATGYLQILGKAQAKFDGIDKQLKEATKDQNEFINDAENFKKLSGNVNQAAIIMAKLNNQIELLNKKSTVTGADVTTDKINDYKKAIEDLLALPTTNETQKDIDDLIAKVKALGGSFDEVKKKGRDIETISDVLKKLKLELTALSTRELAEGLNLSGDKVRAIEQTITKLITNFKVDPNDTIIQKLFGDINAIKFSLPNFKTFIQEFEKGIQQETPPKIPIEIKPVYDKAAFDDAVKRAQVDIAAKSLKLGIDTSAFSGNEVGILSDQLQDLNYINYALMRDFGVGLPASVAKALAAFRQAVVQANALYEANVALNDFVNNYAIASFEALGDAIGTALAGGEFENLFSTLFKTLAEGLKVLGDTMIKAGVEIIAIKLALNSLNPVLAIAAGIALRALGSFVESKAPHLAGGGIIPPGYDGDRFPAMLNSGEAVIPLDKLKDYINPTTEPLVFIPETRLSGNDIVIAYERTTRKNKRTY